MNAEWQKIFDVRDSVNASVYPLVTMFVYSHVRGKGWYTMDENVLDEIWDHIILEAEDFCGE